MAQFIEATAELDSWRMSVPFGQVGGVLESEIGAGVKWTPPVQLQR